MMSYEEIELCYRIEKGGNNILYIPNAEIEHLIRIDRINVPWFYRRFYWQGRSEGLFELIHFGRPYVLKKLFLHLKKGITGSDEFARRYHRGHVVSLFKNFFTFNFN